ncbi:homocysteine S-methyltransferase [Bacillus sp. SB49]|uniref:homocysteine S-methyltransferase n=1 Tax=Bacillus sp. SB49 TaxID=1071080 RepID=UPI00041B70E1|nr:homocysteine S-methyltransferase [Bacillus sp. SB49]QHT45627.1 homocysteine S-methyltransferase [Bacillus sp. SB49]
MSNKINKRNPIKQLLETKKTIILDGALATELETYGFDLDDPLWSARVLLENPDAIRKVHADYFRNGADIAITASYQATIDGFKQRGIDEDKARTLIKDTVRLAQEARSDVWREADDRAYPVVAGSVGPYGAYLADGSEYIGNYGVTDEQLKEFHRPRIEALIEAGADVLAFETIPSLQEAKVLTELLGEYPGASAWLSFSLKNGSQISDGTEWRRCIDVIEGREQVVAVGVNCAPIPDATEAVGHIRALTDKPIILYPNSGETYDPDTNDWYGERSCQRFDEQSDRWVEAGATIIGGCCRTTPDHIQSLARRWQNR